MGPKHVRVTMGTDAVEWEFFAMTTPTRADAGTVDLTAAPRAVLRESMRLLYRVLGEKRLGTAQQNAWDAICADRERARERAEVDRLLARMRRP
jgi:hypothetical protein